MCLCARPERTAPILVRRALEILKYGAVQERFLRLVDCRGTSTVFGVLSADGTAVGPIHHESSAYGGTGFVNPTVHVGAVHCHTPAFFIFSHDVKSIVQMRGEVSWNVVFRLQNNRQATTDGVAP
jgi:hypothetical protein